MKQSHLRGGALLAECAAGRGAIVIVEGEHREDDEYFYNHWFGALGPQISFFAQNGWERVVEAVAELRPQLPHRPVFGIIDRDFADESRLLAQYQHPPTDGIYRLTRYTLENYLLEPNGWHAVIDTLTRGNPPGGWTSPAEVAAQIDAAYRRCIVLAAWNRTVHDELTRQSGQSIGFRDHPAALAHVDPAQQLATWGRSRDPPHPLYEVFAEHRIRLERAEPTQWPIEITGKAVLKVLLRQLQLATSQIPFETLCTWYLHLHPTPHPEIAAVINAILDAAARRGIS
ncbi:MAG: DUF4435 domain-containing protein [Myxococcota bacterium]